jgi:hypothetical protein
VLFLGAQHFPLEGAPLAFQLGHGVSATAVFREQAALAENLDQVAPRRREGSADM